MMDFFIASNHNKEPTPPLESESELEKPGFNDLPMEVSHHNPLFRLVLNAINHVSNLRDLSAIAQDHEDDLIG